MTETPNHGYNVPEEGTKDWHLPLNENFEQYDTDIEVRDTSGNRGDYEPKAGAKFFALDTGTVFVGDGNDWIEVDSTGPDPDLETLNPSGGYLGIGTSQPDAPVDVRSRSNWDLTGTEGDMRIGDDDYRMNFGVALGGVARGTSRIRAKGGVERLSLGAGSEDMLTLDGAQDAVGIGREPEAPVDIRGQNNWNLDDTEGDFRIGTDEYRFLVGVATGGAGSGIVRLRAKGRDADDIHNLVLGAGPHDVARVRATDDDPLGIYPEEPETGALGWGDRRWSVVESKWMYADDFWETSDARLKSNVAPLEGGLEVVNALRPVTFEWDDDGDGDSQVGLIAQEVEETLPEVVDRSGEDEDATLSVSYTKLVPVLIDAVQRQQETIEERDQRIQELEAESERKDERIDDLEQRLSALEAQVDADANAAPADD